MKLEDFCTELSRLRFAAPVTHVYNPLEYARGCYEDYLRRYGQGPKEVMFLGMNPGPWGMAQTGVPFGEITLVRDWLGISGPIGKPSPEHPRRPVLGFDCRRSEVSGARIWGWFRDRFQTPDSFFKRFFVANYCPLVFMEDSGRNRTPDRLPAGERGPLFRLCDEALRQLVQELEPRYVIGVGRFAEARAREALAGLVVEVGRIHHPSPANPNANRGWCEAAQRALEQLGIRLDEKQLFA